MPASDAQEHRSAPGSPASAAPRDATSVTVSGDELSQRARSLPWAAASAGSVV
jgi:hypothetical protein